MNTSIKKKIYNFIIVFLAFSFALSLSISAFAAEATTFFGSESYDTFVGDEFPIGIYINSTVAIGHYELEVRYDNDRLEYMYGAISETNGILYISGDINENGTRTMVSFRAIGGGEAGITVVSAKATLPSSEEEFDITELAYAPIRIAGEDAVGESFKEKIDRENEEARKAAEEAARLEAEKEAAEKEAAEKEAAIKEAAEKTDSGETSSKETSSEDSEEVITPFGQDELTAEEIAEAAVVQESVSSAREIYEQSKSQTVENSGRMSKMIISIGIISMMVLALLITLIAGGIRKYHFNKRLKEESRSERFFSDFTTIDNDNRRS